MKAGAKSFKGIPNLASLMLSGRLIQRDLWIALLVGMTMELEITAIIITMQTLNVVRLSTLSNRVRTTQRVSLFKANSAELAAMSRLSSESSSLLSISLLVALLLTFSQPLERPRSN
jgi:hypothetical protein